jgi:hypothetical protein
MQNYEDQDFEADIELYLTSGQIFNGTTPMSGVQVNAAISSVGTTGLDAADYNNQTTYTDGNGAYSFLVRKNDIIEITPFKENWVFTPETQRVEFIASDTTGLDFAAELPDFNISGIVTRAGKPLKEISVELGEYSAMTDAGGLYEITVPNGTRVTLSPTTPGYSYTPGSREIEINLGNAPYQDFSAIPTAAALPAAGDFQRLTVQLTNQGPAMAKDFWITIFNGEEQVDLFYVKQIKPGGTRTFKRNLPLLFVGDNEFTATVDSGANLDLDLENNSSETTISAIAAAGSDLMVPYAFIYSTSVEGVYYFETWIWNVGSNASEAGQLDIKVSEKKKYRGEIVRVLDAELQSIKPGGSKLMTGYFNRNGKAGFMQLKVDEHIVHPGSNNANDHLQVPFDISRLPAR